MREGQMLRGRIPGGSQSLAAVFSTSSRVPGLPTPKSYTSKLWDVEIGGVEGLIPMHAASASYVCLLCIHV